MILDSNHWFQYLYIELFIKLAKIFFDVRKPEKMGTILNFYNSCWSRLSITNQDDISDSLFSNQIQTLHNKTFYIDSLTTETPP